NIGKKYGDQLALPVVAARAVGAGQLGAAAPAEAMLGRVGGAARGARPRGHRLTAAAAEAEPGRVVDPAGGAHRHLAIVPEPGPEAAPVRSRPRMPAQPGGTLPTTPCRGPGEAPRGPRWRRARRCR